MRGGAPGRPDRPREQAGVRGEAGGGPAPRGPERPGAEGPREGEPGAGEPWIETPEGLLFFGNALLVAPELTVLLPLGVRGAARALGLLHGPSPVLDTFPALAAALLPYGGWLLLLPIALVVVNLRRERRRAPRLALLLFLLLHLGFLGYGVVRWAELVRGG